VSWFNDRGGRIASLLAKDGDPPIASEVDLAWGELDRSGRP
jgi:hypothetical protein